MNKKHVTLALLAGVLIGYMTTNYIKKVPVVNKLPQLGAA